MKKNISIIVALIIISLIISGLVFYINSNKYSGTTIENNESIIKYKAKYENLEYGFSFTYPTTWKVEENVDRYTVAIFKTEQTNLLGIFYVKEDQPINSIEELTNYINKFYIDTSYPNQNTQKEMLNGKEVLVTTNIPGLSDNQSGYIISYPINKGFIQISGQNNSLYKEIFKSLKFN